MPITIHALLELQSNIASHLSSGWSFIMYLHKSAWFALDNELFYCYYIALDLKDNQAGIYVIIV